ncbi:hypothetical protein TrVE_jg9874 [Triparma verrucosa]|uniref:Fungal lipase-type domain-containing protein n=1 Tax=Triparma verrucosa TaxID=1606542 RepID=A0A9W7DLH2_9STRA|nr:hypothetical protein TrVE_jg9874 [Triparma verrucosa]
MNQRKVISAIIATVVIVAIIVATTLTSSNKTSEDVSMIQEFSANGQITGSSLPGTPTDLGDATFGVYFKRDKDTEVITFELTVSAKDNSNDDLLLASVKDGKFSMWTSGDITQYTDDAGFSGLADVGSGANKLFDCDDNVVDLDSWKEQYSVSRSGNVVTLNLGAGGTVYFNLNSGNIPETVVWGDVTGSISDFKQDASLFGSLGKAVPSSYHCLQSIADIAVDASGLAEVDQAAAESLASTLTRRALRNEALPESQRRLSSSLDSQLMAMSAAAYNTNSCGSSGWTPWFALQNSNAYAQICWKSGNTCTIAMRGSDDGSDWWSNIFGNMGTSTVGGVSVPSGFKDQYELLKSSPTWSSWNWARASTYCSGGVYLTGHSLGAAMASMHALDAGLSNLITFASPAVGAKNQYCASGKRYYIDTSWGSDPVPGLPPWMSHTSTGMELEGSFSWFSRTYNLRNNGCGNQGGGGVNPLMHASSQYQWYLDKLT